MVPTLCPVVVMEGNETRSNFAAIEQVLRYEEVAREKALGVLSVLCSREMAKARALWLKEALARSTTLPPKGAAASTSLKVLTVSLGTEDELHQLEENESTAACRVCVRKRAAFRLAPFRGCGRKIVVNNLCGGLI